MIPSRTPFFVPYLYPSLTWRVKTREKELFLTFDDGPVSGPTEFVLDVLDRFSAKATFFCIGDNIRKHPDVFHDTFARGHAIGNHTFNHLNGWKTPRAAYLENVRMCDEIIRKNIINGVPGKLFRPPYGKISRSQIREMKHYQITMWDVLTHDYDKSLSPEACFRRSARATRPGSIIVFHDSLKAEKNLTAVLPRFLEHFTHEGYTFKRLHP